MQMVQANFTGAGKLLFFQYQFCVLMEVLHKHTFFTDRVQGQLWLFLADSYCLTKCSVMVKGTQHLAGALFKISHQEKVQRADSHAETLSICSGAKLAICSCSKLDVWKTKDIFSERQTLFSRECQQSHTFTVLFENVHLLVFL